MSFATGRFGDDTLARDIINYGGLWANSIAEAIYFVGLTDAAGTLLTGNSTTTSDSTKTTSPRRWSTVSGR